jgi:hypothetical protein
MNGGSPAAGGECDTDCAIAASDANCDGSVTPGDALLIFKAYMDGKDTIECPALARGMIRNREVRAGRVTGLPGEEVRVAVSVADVSGLSSFGMGLSYPSDRLEYIGLERSGLTYDWKALEALESEAGRLLVGGYTLEGIERSGGGDLFVLRFLAHEDAGGSGLLAIDDLQDDLADSDAEDGEVVLDNAELQPDSYELEQNSPNPFNMQTEIRYRLPEAGYVDIRVLDIVGREIKTLCAGTCDAGTHRVIWDGRNREGLDVPSGLYVCVMRAGGHYRTIKMMLLK